MKLLICFGLVFILMLIVVSCTCGKKENFTQGYDYLISGCIKKCELDLLRKNPFFVQLQEGGRMTQNYCRMMCASEYNKNDTPDENASLQNKQNSCQLRKPSYYECPLQRRRYWNHK